ncbi:MAG: 5-(carboxyamino)imidazole ribonucleotide synthase, partial [bacterium]
MTTVAVLGGGQLARMLALAAAPLDVRLRCLDPAAEAPAAVAAHTLRGAFDDAVALDGLLAGASVATYELEHVPLATAERVAARLPLRPGVESLRVCADRAHEKAFVNELGGETAPWAAVSDEESLRAAVERVGTPALLKTRTHGFDGRGPVAVDQPEHALAAWERLERRPAVLERRMRFTRELALLAVRAHDGEPRTYPVVETRHRDGILVSAVAPAPGLADATRAQAESLARRVLDGLGHVGVLAMECFEVDGRVVVNELAPRVHNSGHWTIEGAITSQFENHLRAILGLPLGETAARGPSAIVNLIGRLPDTRALLALPDTHLHLYAKAPRPARKLGHVTVLARTLDELHHRVR